MLENLLWGGLYILLSVWTVETVALLWWAWKDGLFSALAARRSVAGQADFVSRAD